MRISFEPAIDERSCLSLLFFYTFSFATIFHSIFLLQKIVRMAGIETPATVSVQITSSMTSFTSEKRLQRNETISSLKVS